MSSSTAKPKRRRSASPPSSGSKKRSNATGSSTKSPSKSINNKEWRQRMKQQRHDYNTHQFLDASATVNAGLFAARRLPEIKSLWRQMVQEGLSAAEENGGRTNGKHMPIRRAGESGGGKISSRHLRRRTNSHRPRRRHRYPRGKDNACLSTDGDGVELDNAVDGTSTAEIDSNARGKEPKRKCRRARRKPALLKQSHSTWWQPQTNAPMQPASLEMHATDAERSHHWIPTHLWHAKRFHVSPPLFGWSVPLLHSNRGSRASLRIASSLTHPKCTLQDATWEINGSAIKIQVKKANRADPSTQQPLHTLLSALKRLCGSDAPFLNDESILAGQRAGEGLLHEIDACPLRPIGPATFLFGPSDIGDGCEDAHVSMLVHPAIHQRVVSILGDVLQPDSEDSDLTLSTAPLALLRIRGRASTSTICNTLREGKGLQAQLSDAKHGTLVGLELPPSSRAELPNSEPEPKSTGIALQSPILLKCHQPNQNYQHLPHNVACSGWDILCHPSIGSSLFQELAVQGGACAIGLVEGARAQLEAYPPLPFFPRDYPDTEEGRLYWEGSGSAAVSEDNDTDEKLFTSHWRDWGVIRTCIEGPRGRINTPLKRTLRQCRQQHDAHAKGAKGVSKAPSPPKLVSRDKTSVPLIRWASLISPDENATVVVRGSFGIPFMQLCHGCGRLVQPPPTQDSDNIGRHRRPRRKLRPPNSIVCASPLSRADAEAHSNLCQQLKGSLSLPALLRCELYCEGKGTLDTGDLIFPIVSHDGEEISIEAVSGSTCDDGEKKQTLPLGVVSAGGFSPSRGKCHGTGFVGAAKLIDAFDGTEQAMGMAMPDSTGRKMMVLKVMVARDDGSTGRHALLSIIL